MRTDRAQREAKAKAQADIDARRAAEAAEAAPAEPPAEPVPGEPPTEPPAEPPAEPAPGEPPVEGVTPPAEPQEPQGFVVELEPSHPAAQGLAGINIATEQEARVVRTLVNGYARRQEVEATKQRMVDLEQAFAAEKQARIHYEVTEQVQGDWRKTPEYAAAVTRYNNILQSEMPDAQQAATEYWEGVVANLDKQTREQYESRMDEEQAAEEQRRGELWANQMFVRARMMPTYVTSLPGFQEWFMNAATAFNAELERGTLPHVTPDNLDNSFMSYFYKRLTAEPSVMAAYRQHRAQPPGQDVAPVPPSGPKTPEEKQRERDAIGAEYVEKYKQDLAARRAGTPPPHPLGSVGGATRDPGAPSSAPAAEDTAGMSAHDIRKAAKKQARDRARARVASG
jgi:hypothetical protein